MKKIILLPAFMTSIVLTAAADEYIDPRTNVVYTYEVGQPTASLKAGYVEYIGPGYGSELAGVQHPGSPDAAGDVVILDRFTIGTAEYVVTSIGKGAFQKNGNIKSVYIPETVTDIGEEAFYHCDSLTAIHLPNSLTQIAPRLFRDCKRLVSATIPSAVNSIGDYAFDGCGSLANITLPESLTHIDKNVFRGCYFVFNFFINKSTFTSNNNWGATLCDAETDEGMMLKDNAIVFCRPWLCVNSVTIPDGVTCIGFMAFSDCSCLTSVTFPNSITSIDDMAFVRCGCLTSVTFPNSITSIGYAAFFSCHGLTTITIPNSVANIGASAFFDCNKIVNVYCYAEDVPNTGADAFEQSAIMSATLHVPAGSVAKYKSASPWSNFGSIIAMDTPVSNILGNHPTTPARTYDLSGRPIPGKAQRGVYVQGGRIKAIK